MANIEPPFSGSFVMLCLLFPWAAKKPVTFVRYFNDALIELLPLAEPRAFEFDRCLSDCLAIPLGLRLIELLALAYFLRRSSSSGLGRAN